MQRAQDHGAVGNLSPLVAGAVQALGLDRLSWAEGAGEGTGYELSGASRD